ncbi:MAG: hypothetical protein Q6373_009460 [Candidatus Sigynarchaeota archaeon]
MIDHDSFIQAIMQGGWDGLVAAGSELARSATSFVIQVAMVAMVFVVLFGVLFHFTGYSRAGKAMIVNGVLGLIILCVVHAWLLGGLPDISAWFRPPA